MYKIVTDSCCDLPYEIIKKEDIPYIPMEIIMENNSFYDNFWETFDKDEFYNAVKGGLIPSTSQINVARYEEFFRQYTEKGIPILYICFSSGLSGSYQNALLAAENIKNENTNAEIYVFDTLSASGGEGMIVLDALNNQKHGMSYKENIDFLENNKMSYQHWVMVDDLNHLYRGGRLNKSAAVVGDLLHVKPILAVNDEGKLFVHSKVRTKARTLTSIVNKIVQTIKESPNPDEQYIIITTSGDFETAELLKKKILEEITPKEIIISGIGATISSHTGYGCVATFVKRNNNLASKKRFS